MTEKHSPTNVGAIKEKIEQGQVKVRQSPKATRNVAKKNTTNKEHSVKGQNGKITDAQVRAWIKAQEGEFTSTKIRDGLGFMSRTQARRVLRRLAKAGVVKIQTKQLSDKRAVYRYTA